MSTPYVDDPDIPQFFSLDVCRAASIKYLLLKNWVNRSPPAILISNEDREKLKGVKGPSLERVADGPKRAYLFTFRRVMQVSITADLVRLGIPPRKAGVAAACFTDVGDTEGGWVGESRPAFLVCRNPGQLYKDGITVLIVRSTDQYGEVRNAKREYLFFNEIFNKDNKSSIIVNLNSIIINIKLSLNLGHEWGNKWLISDM